MAKGSIVVTGDRAIDRKLRELATKEANKVVRKALREAMKPMRAAVEANEPVGETGHLHERVKLRAGRRSRNKISVVVAIDDKDFPEKYYASFRELGTDKMEGDHAMKKAFDDKAEGVKRDAMARILAGIDRAASGGSSSPGGSSTEGASGGPGGPRRDAQTGRFISG